MLGKVWKADGVAACAVSSFPLSYLVSLLRKKQKLRVRSES